MTRIEGLIYAMGKLDEKRQPGFGELPIISVDLSECHQSFAKGYELCEITLFNFNKVDLCKTVTGKSRECIISVDRGKFDDPHQAAELIALAYEMYSKRHAN